MLQFMNAKGYKFEAKYIEVVYNWRRASDERGLKDEERSKFNHEMLQYLKDELVPWHKDYDLSKLEVNRYPICTCTHSEPGCYVYLK